MKAVILAGGKGARLAPYTHIFPKPMMPIGDKAILEILLSQMKHHGVDEVILTVGHLAGLMRAFFQDGTAFGLKIDYSYEEHPLGTAGPLAKIDGLTETFLVANGDILTTLDIADLIRFHHAQKDALITIATHERKVNIDLGVVEMNGDHTVKGYIEKPNLDYLVSMGLYVFEPSVIEYIPQDEYLDFPDLVIKLIAAGKKVSAYPFNGYWQDLGRQDDYEQANIDFEMMRSQFLPEG
ncbi:MAG: sugar phosphate nucleotidyltransferase [Anaerolineaceae bacterium]